MKYNFYWNIVLTGEYHQWLIDGLWLTLKISALSIVLATALVIIGNLVAAPVGKQAGQSNLAEMAVAVNESWRDRNGNTVERVNYFDVVVWGAQADACVRYLEKGRPVSTRYTFP